LDIITHEYQSSIDLYNQRKYMRVLGWNFDVYVINCCLISIEVAYCKCVYIFKVLTYLIFLLSRLQYECLLIIYGKNGISIDIYCRLLVI